YFGENQGIIHLIKTQMKIISHHMHHEDKTDFGIFEHRLTRLPKDKQENDVYNAVHLLTSIGDMLNAIVYSRSQLDITHEYNLIDMLNALLIITFLYFSAGGYDNQFNIYTERMSQYLDTLGWLLYRKR